MKRVMRCFSRGGKIWLAVGLGFLLLSGPLSAAEHEQAKMEAGEPAPRYALGVFLGYTRAEDENEPTIGVEGGTNLNQKWSAGVVIEQTNRGKDTTLLLAGVGYHPTESVRLQLGVGVKDPSETSENVVRLGLAYELELAHEWFIKPYAAYDFIEHEEDEPVVGFYFGKLF